MILYFEKYHGAGNDFILIDHRESNFQLSTQQIAWLCDRHLGVGADGLIQIEKHNEYPFEMKYFNSDGKIGSMCGNGGRCAVSFAEKHGLIRQSTEFLAYDGMHKAFFTSQNAVKISMSPVKGIEKKENEFILNTGSPHLVKFVDDVSAIDVLNQGKKIRNSAEYVREGINVNFVTMKGDRIEMRTYERGVENETLSCGTGTVAVAIVCGVVKNIQGSHQLIIKAQGGTLRVSFQRTDEDVFEFIWLEGPVNFVFAGTVEIE
jgi:diaminopimelate epimerase